MKVQMHVLSVGAGSLESGDLWANAVILDDEQHLFEDDTRLDKGVKTAKVNLDTANNNDLAKRLFKENFPAVFTVEVESSVKKGALVMKIVNFSTNVPKAQ